MDTQEQSQLELFLFPVQHVVRTRPLPRGRQRAARRRTEALPISGSPFAPYQGHPPYVVASDTSREAADSVAGTSGVIRARVFDFISLQGSHGATCDEVEAALGLRHQTASARCRELVLQGRLIKRLDPEAGKSVRRPTRSGRNADVLFAA